MGRPNRGEINHCICHVFQRGNNREFLFKDDDCKGMMIHQFDEFRKKYDYELLGYVIMDNHYHIIIKLNNDDLDDIMFSINNIYAKYINKYLSRSGHVFESRYNNKLVNKDSYLLWLLRYIHRNPLRAKIVDRIDDYYWSSHHFYMKANTALVNTNYILNFISEKKAKAVLAYRKYMLSKGNDNDENEDYKIISKLIEIDLENVSLSDQVPITNNRKSLEELAKDLFGDHPSAILIRSGSKQRGLMPLKITFIHKARELHYSLNEISQYLNCAPSAISYLANKQQ